MTARMTVELILVLLILTCLAVGYCSVLLGIALWDREHSEMPTPWAPPFVPTQVLLRGNVATAPNPGVKVAYIVWTMTRESQRA